MSQKKYYVNKSTPKVGDAHRYNFLWNKSHMLCKTPLLDWSDAGNTAYFM